MANVWIHPSITKYPNWEGPYRVGWKINGKTYWKPCGIGTFGRNNAKSYQHIKKGQIEAGNLGLAVGKAKIQFTKLGDKFLKHIQTYDYKTIRMYVDTFNFFVKSCGNILISDIRRSHIDDFIDEFINDGYSKTTANMRIRNLKTFLNYAIEQDFIDKSPAQNIKQMKVGKTGRFLMPPEIVTLLAQPHDVKAPDEDRPITAFGKKIFSIISFTLNCGLRRFELLSMRWENIVLYTDAQGLKRGILTVITENERHQLRHDNTKSKGKTRRVFFGPVARDVLPEPKESGLVWGDIKDSQLSNAWRYRVAKIGLSTDQNPLRFHDLRHTWGAYNSDQLKDRAALQYAGGWADPKSMAIYEHLFEHRGMENAHIDFTKPLGMPTGGQIETPHTLQKDNDDTANA